VEPFEGIGKYGGTMRHIYRGKGAWRFNDIWRYQRFMKQKYDLSGELVPDLATGFEISSDSKVYTIHLRPGLKWSDGELFTSEDVVFWYEVYTNPELRALVVSTSDRRTSRNPVDNYGIADVRGVDDLTVEIEFERPTGIFMYLISLTWAGIDFHFFPKHYLSQFHASYEDVSELNEMAKKEGLGNWQELFAEKAHWFNNPDLPTVGMFVFESVNENDDTTWVRNPYYYKVDPEGNQLPYIDRFQGIKISDTEALVVAVSAGNSDIQSGQLRAAMFPVLKQNEQAGGYRVGNNPNAKGGEFSLFFNLTTENLQLREVFQDIRFRQAVSLALNRQEIIDTVFFGQAEARQASPTLDDPTAIPEWSNAFIEFDPERANQLLDEMGLSRRGSDGFRLGKDGRPMEIAFDWDQTRGFDDAYVLVAEYLEDVGLNIRQRVHGQRATFMTEVRANTAEMHSFSWVPSVKEPDMLLPDPEGIGSHAWARAWGTWFETDGAEGTEPPDDLRRVEQLISDARASLTVDEYVAKIKEANRIHMENLWVIGVFGNDWRGVVVNDRLHNVGDLSGPYYSLAPMPAGTKKPETWWLEQ
jgi:peptide/nickel transport system substrate-binding protein